MKWPPNPSAVLIATATIAIAGASLATTGPAAGAATSSAASARTLDLTPGHSASYDGHLADFSSPSDLLYQTANEAPGTFGRLHVDSASGTTTTLIPPSGDSLDINNHYDPAAVQNMVAAEAYHLNKTPVWLYWDLSSGEQGALQPLTGYVFDGAAPGGVLAYDTADEDLSIESESGQVTDLGEALPTSYYTFESDGGVLAVADDSSGVSYMSWSDPGVFTPLDIDYPALSHQACFSVGTDSAGCRAKNAAQDLVILRVPLEGSAPVESVTDSRYYPCRYTAPAVTATATVWGCDGELDSVPSAGGAISSRPSDGATVNGRTALGGAILTTRHGGVDTVSDAASGPTVILSPQHAPVQAHLVAITDHSVAYQDDKSGVDDVYERTITDGKHGPAVSSQRQVPGFGHMPLQSLAVTDHLTAAVGEAGLNVSIRYDGRTSHPALKNTASVTELTASGTRVAVSTILDMSGSATRSRTLIDDAATHKEITVNNTVSAAICGNHLATIDADGTVHWLSLNGGHDVTVAKTHSGQLTFSNSLTTALCSGNEVGWVIERYPTAGRAPIQGVEQVKTHRTTKIDGELAGISSAGVLSRTANTGPDVDAPVGLQLTAYGHKHASSVPSARVYGDASDTSNRAELNHIDAAWVTPDGQVQITRLP